MPRLKISDAVDLTAQDVMHAQFSALPASATVADVREWFAASASRRVAFLADGERYAGSLTPADLEHADPGQPAAEVAAGAPTVAPAASATTGRDLALRTDSRRVPVVDEDGRLLGVVAVTSDLQSFCGTGS
jgi:Mg/Co/Ni transporter MgtE